LASAVKVLALPEGLIVMEALPKTLPTAVFTLSSLSVGLISAST